jgi:hypothetical protein
MEKPIWLRIYREVLNTLLILAMIAALLMAGFAWSAPYQQWRIITELDENGCPISLGLGPEPKSMDEGYIELVRLAERPLDRCNR